MDNYKLSDLKVQDNIERENLKYLHLKGVLDSIIAIFGLIISSPIIFVVSILVMIETPGNPFYSQERLGKYNKPFKIFKIRSMYCDAEKNGAQWAKVNDERITRIGSFIRKTRIDELPQFLNILLGDMSLIGPRPERESLSYEFSKEIPEFLSRLNVKPGLTGWAQVNGGYELTPREKLAYDLYYIKHQSLVLDLKIVLMTFKVIVTGHGSR